MAYADKIHRKTIEVDGDLADNVNISQLVIPKGKRFEVKEMFAIIGTAASNSGDTVLIREAFGGTVHGQVSLEGSAGAVNRGAGFSTKPLVVAPTSADRVIDLQVNSSGTLGASTDVTVVLDYCYPGSYAVD